MNAVIELCLYLCDGTTAELFLFEFEKIQH